MDCESNIIHNLDLAWALLATIGGAYPLVRLLEHCNKQSGRDLFALIFTFVAYPWAMATMHLTPFDKGLVYAICLFSIPFYGVAVMRLVGLENQKLTPLRQLSLLTATALGCFAISNPWHGQFALFDVPVLGQPNHLLDYQTPKIGAYLTLLFAGIVVLGTAWVASLRLLRSRFIWSYSLLGVCLPIVGLLAYLNNSLFNLIQQWQVSPYFVITTLALYYFTYQIVRGRLGESLPIAHNQIISLMPDAIVIVNGQGLIDDYNPAFEVLVGSPKSDILQQPLSTLLPQANFSDDNSVQRQLLTLPAGDADRHLDIHLTPLTGSDPQEVGKMILMRDVTDQTSAYQQLQASERQLHQANNELARLSTTDSLTGLRNRRYFQQQLEQELERYNRSGTTFGLLSLDLDHFKTINDCHGHQTGDAVLEQTSRILEAQCRAADTLARVGGEEFMILLVDCDQTRLLTAAERIRKAVEEHVVDTQTKMDLTVTTSIGATLVHPEDSMRGLLHRVDDLLYCAKRQGRNRSNTV